MMRLILFLLSLGLIVGLSACDDKPQHKKKVVRPHVVVKKPVTAVKKEVVKTTKAQFRYVVEDRRDPFTSLLIVRNPLEDTAEPETPLQKFGLKEVRLVAIVIGKGEPRAMVKAPDNKAYMLSVGVKIGRNHGVVTGITNEEVVVEERYRDFSGSLRTEMQKITLPTREGK